MIWFAAPCDPLTFTDTSYNGHRNENAKTLINVTGHQNLMEEDMKNKSDINYDRTAKEVLFCKPIAARIVQRFIPKYAQLTPEEIVPRMQIVEKQGEKRQLEQVDLGDEEKEKQETSEAYLLIHVPAGGMSSRDDTIARFFMDIEHLQAVSDGTALVRKSIADALMFARESLGAVSNKLCARPQPLYSLRICMDPLECMKNQIRVFSMPTKEELLTNVAMEGHEVESMESEEAKDADLEKWVGLLNVALVFLGNADKTEDPLLQMLDTLFAKTDPKECIRKLEEDFHLPLADSAIAEILRFSSTIRGIRARQCMHIRKSVRISTPHAAREKIKLRTGRVSE